MTPFEQRELFAPYIDLKTVPDHILWPETLPAKVKLIWRGAIEYFQKTGSDTPLTEDALAARINLSVSTIYRVRKLNPQLLPWWPIERHHRPPWLRQPKLAGDMLPDPTPIAIKPEDQPVVTVKQYELGGDLLEVTYDESGIVKFMRRISGGAAMLAALWAVGTLLDMSDGRLDGVLHWCRILRDATGIAASVAT